MDSRRLCMLCIARKNSMSNLHLCWMILIFNFKGGEKITWDFWMQYLKGIQNFRLCFDTEFFVSASTRIHMKHLAVETCANFLARTISQSEFRVKTNGTYVKDELYYKMNVRQTKIKVLLNFGSKSLSI